MDQGNTENIPAEHKQLYDEACAKLVEEIEALKLEKLAIQKAKQDDLLKIKSVSASFTCSKKSPSPKKRGPWGLLAAKAMARGADHDVHPDWVDPDWMDESTDPLHDLYLLRGRKPIQSGKIAKPSHYVVKQVKWAQQGLKFVFCPEFLAKEPTVDDLPFHLIVAGEIGIILSLIAKTKIPTREVVGRLKLLEKMLYWYHRGTDHTAILAFYSTVLRDIEQGQSTWSTPTNDLEVSLLAFAARKPSDASNNDTYSECDSDDMYQDMEGNLHHYNSPGYLDHEGYFHTGNSPITVAPPISKDCQESNQEGIISYKL